MLWKLRALLANLMLEEPIWLEGRVVPKVLLSWLEDPVGLIDKASFPMRWQLAQCVDNCSNQNVQPIKDKRKENPLSA